MKFFDWMTERHPEAIKEDTKPQWTNNRFSKKPYYKNSRSRRLDLQKKREESKNREEE